MDACVLIIDRKQGASTASQIGMPGVQGKAVAEAYSGAAEGGCWTLSPRTWYAMQKAAVR